MHIVTSGYHFVFRVGGEGGGEGGGGVRVMGIK